MFDLNAVNLEFTAFKYLVVRRDAEALIAGAFLAIPPLQHPTDLPTTQSRRQQSRSAARAYACANEISTLPMFCSRALTLLPLSANSKPVHDPVVTN